MLSIILFHIVLKNIEGIYAQAKRYYHLEKSEYSVLFTWESLLLQVWIVRGIEVTQGKMRGERFHEYMMLCFHK